MMNMTSPRADSLFIARFQTLAIANACVTYVATCSQRLTRPALQVAYFTTDTFTVRWGPRLGTGGIDYSDSEMSSHPITL